uniref:Uncharacterized protein n=1 Tax=Culex tarsalis TaxID=7177 RepID=A0A1Q3EWZ5_CULTA
MAKVPPRNPKYSAVDLWPPGSKGNVDFPPAAFFPVYLGNFLCQQQGELVSRVQQYFAAKGLLARMVFVRSAQNDAFRNYQDRTKLYDCLVYFTRELDALDAVKYLHRDKYHGHRLNIFPGRERLYFESDKTVDVRQLPGVTENASTESFEDKLVKITAERVVCCARNSPQRVLVEFGDHEKMMQAVEIANQDKLYLARIPTDVWKQRFIEQDVEGEIRCAKIDQHLPNILLQRALYEGRVIDVTDRTVYKPTRRAVVGDLHYVREAMRHMRELAKERQLDVKFQLLMFPDSRKQLLSIARAVRGDQKAEAFLQTYRAPWQVIKNDLILVEEQHVVLHNDVMQYMRQLVENIKRP